MNKLKNKANSMDSRFHTKMFISRLHTKLFISRLHTKIFISRLHTNIFIHVESLDIFEGQLASFVKFNEFAVHAQWSTSYLKCRKGDIVIFIRWTSTDYILTHRSSQMILNILLLVTCFSLTFLFC